MEKLRHLAASLERYGGRGFAQFVLGECYCIQLGQTSLLPLAVSGRRRKTRTL